MLLTYSLQRALEGNERKSLLPSQLSEAEAELEKERREQRTVGLHPHIDEELPVHFRIFSGTECIVCGYL